MRVFYWGMEVEELHNLWQDKEYMDMVEELPLEPYLALTNEQFEIEESHRATLLKSSEEFEAMP